MKKFKIIVTILIMATFIFVFVVSNTPSPLKNEKVNISVSTFSLYDIVKNVSQETVNIINILPFGVDPHSFEPTPRVVANIQNSNLVVYSGAGLEPWIEGFNFKNSTLNMSEHIRLIRLDEDEHHHHDEHGSHNGVDPHYWLDFENMKIATKLITSELIKLLPENKDLYLKNRNEYLAMLDRLNVNYLSSLSSCKKNSVILNHNSIGYIAEKYDFHVESLSGLSPEAEPTADDIKRIFNEIKENEISAIFFETFVNSKVIHSIAKDMNITLETLQPLGNITADEAKANVTYKDVMLKNLKKLSKVLDCN